MIFEAAFRNLGLAGPVPVVEVESDPNALVLLARQVGLLVCIPRLAMEAEGAKEALRVLDLPDLRLPPIQVGFVTSVQNEMMVPVQTFRQALIEAAAERPS